MPSMEQPQEEAANEIVSSKSIEAKTESPVENFVHTKVFETFGVEEKPSEEKSEQNEKNEEFPVVDEVAERSPDNVREMLASFFKYHCEEGRPDKRKYWETKNRVRREVRKEMGFGDEPIDIYVYQEKVLPEEVRREKGNELEKRKENQIELLEKLAKAYETAKQTARLTINTDNVTKVLESGKLIPFAELDEKERKDARKTGGAIGAFFGADTEGYDKRRDEREKDLGIYTADGPRPVYMAIASDYKKDELARGAARQYGPFVITVNPERVKSRVVCTVSDSMNITGLIEPFQKLHEDGTAKKQQLSFEHALIAKAMYDVHHELLAETHLTNSDRMTYEPGDLAYIEAQVLGGVSLSDIESINIEIPRSPNASFDPLNRRNPDAEMRTKGTAYYRDKYPDLIIEK